MKHTIGNIGSLRTICCIVVALSLAPSAGVHAQGSTSVYSFSGHGGRGWLGVSVQDVTKKLAESRKLKTGSGAYVSDVNAESPAEKAGILEGDVIVKFDGRSIEDRDELISAVRRAEPGEEVAVVVDRLGVTKTLTATLDAAATPRAMTFTVPGHPSVAPTPHSSFGMRFYTSGERLGMDMQTLGKQMGEFLEVPGNRGVLVNSVDRDGAAASAGLKAGDVIVRVNRNSVRDVDDVLTEIGEADRDTLPFEVVRKGKAVTLTVDVGRERDDTSELFNHWDLRDLRNLGELRDSRMRREWSAFGEDGDFDRLRKSDLFDEDFTRDLKESIRDLKRDIEREARDFERELGRKFRES